MQKVLLQMTDVLLHAELITTVTKHVD